MRERLAIIATNTAGVASVQAVPLQGGWGNPRISGLRRLWGVWTEAFIPGQTRPQLIALRDAGTIRVHIMDADAEDDDTFRARWVAVEGEPTRPAGV